MPRVPPPRPGCGPRLLSHAERRILPPKTEELARTHAIRIGFHPFPAALADWVPPAVLRSPSALAHARTLLPPSRPPTPQAPENYYSPLALYFINQPPTNRRPRLIQMGLPPLLRANTLTIATALCRFWATPANQTPSAFRKCRVCLLHLPLGGFGTPTTRVCDLCTTPLTKWRRLR